MLLFMYKKSCLIIPIGVCFKSEVLLRSLRVEIKKLIKNRTVQVACTNVDQNLIADQCNFRDKYLQNGEKN